MYSATTENVTVSVTPFYLENQSRPDVHRWVWAYTVAISNAGPRTMTLRSRYWHITDGDGHVEEVQGPGVVGEQPTLAPGDSYTYTSGCPLATPSGFMEGEYRMEDDAGVMHAIAIPIFSLDLPAHHRVLN